MNFLPWNIVRKDFRLTRNYLVAWWGILAAGMYDIRWCLNKIISDPEAVYNNARGDYMAMSTSYFASNFPFFMIWAVIALNLLGLIVLVDAVIKADSPIDERAEWRTRPVSGLGVWRAKLFYFGCFCFLLPGATFTLVFILHGGRLAEAAQWLAQWGIVLACLIAAVASAAVLFQRTFAGLLVFVVMALGFFLLDLANLVSDGIFENLNLSFSQGWINAWAALGLFVITGLVVSAMSYDGRRRTPCRVVLGGGILAALLALWAGPRRSFGNITLPRQQDDRVKMALQPASNLNPDVYVHQLYRTRERATDSWTEYDGFSVQVSYQARQDETCQLDSVYWKLTFSNPAPTPPKIPRSLFENQFALLNLAPAVATAGYGTLLEENFLQTNVITVSLGKKEDLDRLGPSTAKLEAHYSGKTGHLEVVSDVPFANWAVWENGLKMFKVEFELYPWGPGYQRFTPSQMGQVYFNWWEVNTDNFNWLASPPIDARSQIVLLYNPLKQQSIQGSKYVGGDVFAQNGNISIYSLKRGSASFNITAVLGNDAFPHRYGSRQELDQWVATHADLINQYQKTIADWLAGARLVELRFVPDRAIYNTVTIDAIPLTPIASAPAAITFTP